MSKFTESRISKQSIPQGRVRIDLETGVSTSISSTTTKFATKEELIELQKELETTIKEQNNLIKQLVIEMKQQTWHLRSMSDANVKPSDVEVD